MNAQETIDTMKVAIAEVEWNYPLDYAIAFEEAIKALEKQIPRKLLVDNELYHCPGCGEKDAILQGDNYCFNCGQALDWSDADKALYIKLPYKVTAEVYSVLDREEFPKGVYKCEVSAYLIDSDGELYSLMTVTVGDRTIVGIKTDIENMYATRGEAETALREKEAEE